MQDVQLVTPLISDPGLVRPFLLCTLVSFATCRCGSRFTMGLTLSLVEEVQPRWLSMSIALFLTALLSVMYTLRRWMPTRRRALGLKKFPPLLQDPEPPGNAKTASPKPSRPLKDSDVVSLSDEAIVKLVLSGGLPVYSLESVLGGDCLRAVSIRRKAIGLPLFYICDREGSLNTVAR